MSTKSPNRPARRKLHWVCPAPSPFHSYLFRAIAQEEDIDLVVHFGQAKFEQHPWKSQALDGFESRVCATRFGVDWSLVWLTMRDRDALLMLPGWYDRTTRVVSALCRMPFAMWTDTPQVDLHRPPVKRFVRSLWARWIFRRARYLLSTGQPGVGALRRMGAPEDKLVNLPFFVPRAAENERANRARLSDDDTVRFVAVGRLVNQFKGFDFALTALARAREVTGKDNFHLTFAGTGPDEPELRAQAERLGISHLVTFAGWLEAEETAALLRASHVMLHPARQDAFPIAVLDALANGVVVLGSERAGSVRDRVVDGENGFVHATGDTEGLARQIAGLLRDPSQLHDMGRRAWESAGEWPVTRGVSTVRALLQRTA